MSAEVVKFYPANAADDPNNVLEQAVGVYDAVLLIGWDKDGRMECRASTNMNDGGDVLWLLEQFKLNLLQGVYSGDGA